MSNTADQQRFIVDGREPAEVVIPASAEDVAETLKQAGENKRAVVPIGQGAFLHLGGLPRRYDVALSTEKLNQIIDYQPTDMTVSVEAGMTLAQLQAVLGEHGQWLPIDAPNPHQTTIGGMIATNLSGPSRLSQGTIRDFLIGLKIVRADGSIIKGGGKVVKNVAGYDLPKLYCGSFGTLGVIVEATFKVRPRPEAQAALLLSCISAEQAMDVATRILSAELQPFFLDLANFDPLNEHGNGSAYRLFIGVAGIAEEVAYQRERLGQFVGQADGAVNASWQSTDEQALFLALRDFPVSGEAVLRCKASLVPTAVAAFCRQVEAEAQMRDLAVDFLARAGNGIVYSRVRGPNTMDTVSSDTLLSFVDWLRITTKRLAGYVVVEGIDHSLKDRLDVWGHIGSAFPLMKKLKETLDPDELLNPGRFVGGI